MSDTFNGWSNRETWAAACWFWSDEGLCRRGLDALSALPSGAARFETASALLDAWHTVVSEHLADPLCPHDRCLTIAMLEDVGSIWRVDWSEVGDALIDAHSVDRSGGRLV